MPVSFPSTCSILRQIVRALEAAPGHILPEEYFLHLLEQHFGAEEAEATEAKA